MKLFKHVTILGCFSWYLGDGSITGERSVGSDSGLALQQVNAYKLLEGMNGMTFVCFLISFMFSFKNMRKNRRGEIVKLS